MLLYLLHSMKIIVILYQTIKFLINVDIIIIVKSGQHMSGFLNLLLSEK